eukprot:s2967_g10.t1
MAPGHGFKTCSRKSGVGAVCDFFVGHLESGHRPDFGAMGGLLDCFPLPSGSAAAPVTTRANGKAWADVVVKIGGSACTRKAEFETLNVGALQAISSQLSALPTEGYSLAVVHGAGSFGHQHAKEYGVSKGSSEAPLDLTQRLREGFAKTLG